MIIIYLETFLLSLVQGISEFIPVSSSAHLIIISQLSNFETNSLEIDISLHLGSLAGIIFYFREELINILKNKNLALLIFIGSLPLIIVGFIIYQTGLISYLRNIKIIAWTTLIFGILLFYADKFKIKKNIDNDLTLKNILFIGFFQILALIPGVSRSGITITASRLLNFDRYDSSKIAFLLSVPALMGASLLSLKDIWNLGFNFSLLVIFSALSSFIFSYLTIKYFLIYIRKFTLSIFVIYRILLSLFLFLIIYL
tara:strand:- start:330 stop:1097 length:768 start_codon:yes stop_codon:yes gene_type:complete